MTPMGVTGRIFQKCRAQAGAWLGLIWLGLMFAVVIALSEIEKYSPIVAALVCFGLLALMFWAVGRKARRASEQRGRELREIEPEKKLDQWKSVRLSEWAGSGRLPVHRRRTRTSGDFRPTGARRK